MNTLLRILSILCLVLTALPAKASAAEASIARADRAQASVAGAGEIVIDAPQNHGDEPPQSLAETPDKDFFLRNFVHLIPHPLFGGHGPDGATFTTFYNSNLFQVIAIVLMLVIFTTVKNSFAGPTPSGLARIFRGWCHWLRDEVIYSVMGEKDGRAWAPYFLYVFFFVAFMNLMGLVPVVGVTSTASYYVTGTLAGTTFFCMLFFGFKQQGVLGFFKHLVPPGLPLPLILLMAPIELIGLFIKPFALMVRLFANMLGGHMVVYAFLGMIFLFAKMMEGSVLLASMTALPAFGMSVFILIIEAFIALLQAYVFTYLSVIFVHQAMHPAH